MRGDDEAASEHRMMEARLKLAEQKAAKETNSAEAVECRKEAKELAKELADKDAAEAAAAPKAE